MPRMPFSTCSEAVPAEAISARLFLITRYFPPAPRTVLRSSKSWLTFSFSYPVTKRFSVFARSWRRASTSLCLSSFFFMETPLGARPPPLRAERGGVDGHSRTHRGAHGRAPDVLALGHSRLRFDH